MNKIDMAPGINPLKNGAIRPDNVQLVPSNLRNFDAGLVRKTDHLAAKNPQARRATIELFAPFEEGLIADTNAEKRPARLDEVLDGAQQLLSLHGIDAIVKRANAGENDRACVRHFVGPCDHAHIRPDFEQRLLDAAQIPRTIVNERDHKIEDYYRNAPVANTDAKIGPEAGVRVCREQKLTYGSRDV